MDYKQLDKQYVWHPFTQMRDWVNEDIIAIDRGEGVWLYDTDGNRYLDGVASLWVNVHGHANAELNKAIADQLQKISHTTFLGLTHPLAAQLAEQLVLMTHPNLKKVFYSDNGSTSMEIALKIAYQYWQQADGGKNKSRTKFITFSDAYHGDTIGSVSLGAMDLFHKIYKPLLFECYNAPYPYPYWFDGDENACKEYCLNELRKIFENHGDTIAAVVIEPEVQGAAGMKMTPKGFMKELEQIVRQYGALLVVDEVATGFGRTGKMFANERESIQPDIMSVAKSITGGYLPVAATLTSDKIYEAFLGDYSEQKTFFHGHTYTANPLGCAAALCNLELMKKNNIVDNVVKRAKQADSIFNDFKNLAHVGDIRQKGLMIGIELVKDKQAKEPYDWSEQMGVKVINEARKHEVIIRPLGNVIVLMPPLCISDSELDHLFYGTYESIKKVTE